LPVGLGPRFFFVTTLVFAINRGTIIASRGEAELLGHESTAFLTALDLKLPAPIGHSRESGPSSSTPGAVFCGTGYGTARSCDRGPPQYRILGLGTGDRCLAVGVHDRRVDQIWRARCVVSRDGFPQSPPANQSGFADSVSLAARTRNTDLNSGFSSIRPASASSYPNASLCDRRRHARAHGSSP
jgi:hypothetical protein